MQGTKSFIAAVATAAALALALSPAAAQQTRISITTGGTGGVYYPMGGGMANILSKYVPGLTATAEVTGGSVDNLKLIHAGKSEVAFSMVDAGWEAYEGVDKFKDNKVNVRTRGKEKTEDMPTAEFVEKIGKLIQEKTAGL